MRRDEKNQIRHQGVGCVTILLAFRPILLVTL